MCSFVYAILFLCGFAEAYTILFTAHVCYRIKQNYTWLHKM